MAKTPPAPAPGAAASSIWSGHWCDVHQAVAEGCPIDPAVVRAAIGDQQTWQQEYECVFLSGRDQYIGLDLILACQDAGASLALPRPGERGWQPESAEREFYLGYDVARVNDLAVLAVVVLLSLFNAILRPVLLLFTLPFIVLSLGLGVLVINAVLFLLVPYFVRGFHVDGFIPALLGSVIVSLTNLVMTQLLRDKKGGPPPPRRPRGGGGDVIDI